MNLQPDLTQLLQEANQGGAESLDRLIPFVYDQLRAIAGNQMRQERPDHTLSPTALVHEAYLKLIDQERVTWQNRAHFFAISAKIMRRLLINYAEQRAAEKRGGDQIKVTLDEHSEPGTANKLEDLLELNRALDKLAELDPTQAKIVELRYFGGLTNPEIAEALKVSESTVQRGWSVARAWLNRELSENS